MAKKKKDDKDLFGKRSIRSYIRQSAGALSELPIFENKYYDLFRTPLDTFQERFTDDVVFYGWRDENDNWVETDTATLYDLWRKTGAPALEDRPYSRHMTAPREFAYSDDPNKLQKALGYLFGVPRTIFGTKSPRSMGRAHASDLVAESAHGVMFENLEKYDETRKSLIEKMKTEGGTGYDDPTSIEGITHGKIEPKIIEWIREL
jgi:hypothetical protein